MNNGKAMLTPRYGQGSLPATERRPAPKALPRRPEPKSALRPESLTASAKARAAATAKRSRTAGMMIKPKAILTFAAVLGLLFFIVYASMSISVANSENSKLFDELCALQEEEKQLRNEYGGIYNLSEVESYAANVKGMIKPGREQIAYVDMAGEDGAVLVPQQSFWESLGSFFSAIGTNVTDFFG